MNSCCRKEALEDAGLKVCKFYGSMSNETQFTDHSIVLPTGLAA